MRERELRGIVAALALLAGAGVGTLVHAGLSDRRTPASLWQPRMPTYFDRRAALKSDVLLYGAQREEFVQQSFVYRWRGLNSFGIVTLHGNDESVDPANLRFSALERLGAETVTFRGRYEFDGREIDILLRFEPAREGKPAFARRLDFTSDNHEHGYRNSDGTTWNELENYVPALGTLVSFSDFPEESQDGRYQNVRPEFPLRNEPRSAGRLFAWNVDRANFEVVGTVRWQRLTEPEWRTLRALWRKGWRDHPELRSGIATAYNDDDPERFFD